MFETSWGWLHEARARLEGMAWRAMGSKPPLPPYAKSALLRKLAAAGHYQALVETGTYLGDGLARLSPLFPRSFSIEVEPGLHARGKERFARRKDVELLLGDSGTALKALLSRPDFPSGPVFFWLDGHYSGGITGQGALETPIMAELETVLSRRSGDLVLVDDARCFGVLPDYPTLDGLRRSVAALRPDLAMQVEDDIIRISGARP